MSYKRPISVAQHAAVLAICFAVFATLLMAIVAPSAAISFSTEYGRIGSVNDGGGVPVSYTLNEGVYADICKP